MKKKPGVKKKVSVTKTAAKRRPGRIAKPRLPHNATWLKTQLLIAGITQREIASELGADFSTVNHLITGRRPMRDADAETIAGMLKMSVALFLSKLRSESAPTMPEGLARAVGSGEIEITGWVDGKLVVHDGKPKGPGMAPPLPDGTAVKVVRCQTQGSVFDGLDGALVYYTPTEGVDASAVGHMCVVKVRGGESLLRVVKRGYTAGRFNLSLLNGVTSEEDAHLSGASPVIWLKM